MGNCCSSVGEARTHFPDLPPHSQDIHHKEQNVESKYQLCLSLEANGYPAADSTTAHREEQPVSSKRPSGTKKQPTTHLNGQGRCVGKLKCDSAGCRSSTASSSSRKAHHHASTGPHSCLPFLGEAGRSTTAATSTDGTSSRGKGTTPRPHMRKRLLSLQSSGSWIPAILSSPATTTQGSHEQSADGADSVTGGVSAGSDNNSGSCHGAYKKATQKDNSSTPSQADTAEVSLTLVVSSHSNSSHHDSPRAYDACSTTSSTHSGHTAFTSVADALHSSGSLTPDSMLSALSNTSSLLSTCSGSTGCYKSRPAAAAAVSAAAPAVDGGHTASGLKAHKSAPLADSADGGGVLAAAQHQQQTTLQPQPQPDLTGAAVTPQATGHHHHHQQQQQQPELPAFWRSSGWSFGSHSDQNLRAYMEDRSVAIDFTGHAAFPAADRAGLFSVYDGHGGHQVAEFLAEHVQSALLAAGADAITAEPLRALGNAVQDAERQLLVSYAEGDSTAAAGSTLCAVLLIDDKLHVAHVGDSRAVLARGTTAKQLTRDHKPACEIEALRIRDDDPAAEVSADGYIYGELAVARAIGSAHLKRDPSKKALIATPEVATIQLEKQDDFVVIATDGLWDTISSTEAVSVARRVLSDSKDAAATSRALVERAQRCGSSDNISVVTLLLHSRGIVVPRSNSRLFKRPATAAPPSPASATAAPASTDS